MRFLLLLLILGSGLSLPAQAGEASANSERWKNGPSSDPHFFPIAVWLQQPANAERFKAAGINLYVGLYAGPTREQLDMLSKSGMPVICDQNALALANINDPIIVGWMHQDEPDNAQALENGKGYGPPISPETIVENYQKMKAADPSRPILLNLGQGVAWDSYIGRGVRSNHPEDYPLYLKGCDMASFDIYPVVHDDPAIAGKLEIVGKGVKRLADWTEGKKAVWNCIECTHIGNSKAKATPAQIRAEVWIALVQGSRGLIYFAHEFEPAFKEAALLEDPVTLQAVTEINRQIQSLAPVLNSPSIEGAVTIESASQLPPIATMVKRVGENLYLFAVNTASQPNHGEFKINPPTNTMQVEILGESRHPSFKDGKFDDDFKPYEVHLYRFFPAG